MVSPETIKTYYTDILRRVENDLKNNGTTNNEELNKYCKKKIKKFIGVFPSDSSFFLKNHESAIINVDDSAHLGSHWLAIINYKNKMYAYDSFGRTIQELINNKHYSGFENTNNNIEQSIYEDNCGQRCIAFLLTFKKYGLDTIKAI